MLLGFAVVIAAAGTLPLSRTHFRHQKTVRRLHVFAFITGILLLMVCFHMIRNLETMHD